MIAAGCSNTSIVRGPKDTGVQTKQSFIDDICAVGRTKTTTYVTQSISIGDYNSVGPINQRSQIPTVKYSSAIATPRVDKIEHKYIAPGTCKKIVPDAWGRPTWLVSYFPDCEHTEKYEIDDVYGIARADSLWLAEDLALENCEASVERLLDTHDDLYDYSDKLECIVVSKSDCQN